MALVRWEHVCTLGQFRIMSSAVSVLVRHVLREAISTADFMANWACTYRVHHCFLSPQAFLSAYLGLLICKHSKYLMLGVRFYLSFCFYYFIIFFFLVCFCVFFLFLLLNLEVFSYVPLYIFYDLYYK